MFRRFLPCLGLAALVLAGCGGTSTSGVTAGLGGKGVGGISLPAMIPGPLDGQMTPRKLALRRPLAVIVENYDPDSRPQSGLGAASTVIETLAEGGVTRFMALYLEHDAASVGPVRSTRLYFDNWAAAFHAILGHVGGNDDAQALLWHLPSVYNLDENRWEKSLYVTGTPLFWRTNNRVAPHNLYTSTYKLRSYAASHDQNWDYANAAFLHKPAAPLQKRGHAATIDINWQNPLGLGPNPGYQVHYQFNRKTDTYLRFMAGQPHIDADTNKQIAPANVIVMHTADATSDPNAGITPESILIPNIGRGRATYFIDGKVRQGTWVQANRFAPLRFYGAHGHQVQLDPGQTWIECVPASSTVTWSAK